MSILMKTKLSVAILGASLVLGVGLSSTASAADSVTFTTTINVDSVNKCTANTEAGAAGSSWSLKWTLTAADPTTGSIDYTAAQLDPLTVKVSVDDAVADACHLNAMTIGVDMGSSTPVGGSSAAFKQTTRDGFWRYMPVVADAKFYTDNKFNNPVAGTVSVKGADGLDYLVNNTTKHAGQTAVSPPTGWNWGSNDAVVISNGYLDQGGYAPLTAGGAAAPVSFKLSAAGQDIDSAEIGVSAIIAANPEDAAGATDVNVVTDKDSISMPFTVNVTYM